VHPYKRKGSHVKIVLTDNKSLPVGEKNSKEKIEQKQLETKEEEK